ncbi:putative non-specific serine/threonine protein kinase [Helianthus annuus]|nr:putative non-specific serine/threonine protein kinase [Helianthus annuus]KAJ0630102.1 putative non-specific serine/threonine protein kinase [Helianthus annuus]
MSAKCLLFSRSFLFVIIMHFATFSKLIHTSAAQSGTTSDRLALLAIKSMIKGDPQVLLSSWNQSSTDFCQWQGVTCSPRHQRVTHLNLTYGGLTGTLSSSIGNLSFLRVIRLPYNSFSGEIPPEIGRLFRLRKLSLVYNSFTGNIPATITNCSNLQFLKLGLNNLVGKIPNEIGRLFRLQKLFLYNNFLSGNIPATITNCSNLQDLNLGLNNLVGNSFTGNLLSILPTLHTLSLCLNNFGGILPSLTNVSALIFLDLSDNYFVGSLHNLVCSNGVNTIELVDLGYNQLLGVIPECWEKWSSLKVLYLNDNNLSGEIPRTLGSVPLLQLLNLRGNMISGSLPSSLMNLSYLKILQLQKNNLAGIIPPWIGIKLTMLKILNLRSNNFYGNTPNQLCYLSHVQVVDLAHNNLSGNIPRCFNNFSVLSGKETNLKVQFSFYFDNGTFIFYDLLVMKGREDNYGSILGLVTLLDLSSNNLSGQIPSELTTLHKLKSLNLSRNQLTGKIPNKIGDMKSLESFDLSINYLSGELPLSLSGLNFLSSFNVSYNNLTGRIPTGTQIQSFNESSFIGNKLCGAPLTNDCGHVDKPDTTSDQKEDGGSHKVDWGLIISIALGFIIGFWGIVVSLMLNRSWRITYFRLLLKLIEV